MHYKYNDTTTSNNTSNMQQFIHKNPISLTDVCAYLNYKKEPLQITRHMFTSFDGTNVKTNVIKFTIDYDCYVMCVMHLNTETQECECRVTQTYDNHIVDSYQYQITPEDFTNLRVHFSKQH